MDLLLLSPFESLTRPALERVAYFVATDSLLGPPTDLVSLLCTSRFIYNHLSYPNNTHLYADIFRFKFDTSAIKRRLSDRWSTTPALAQELLRRCSTLKRIKRGEVTLRHHRNDLWMAYLMLLESDGRNECHLFHWAHLRTWVCRVIAFRMYSQNASCGWFTETEGTSLATWLLWMSTTREDLTREQPLVRDGLLHLIKPFLVLGHQNPSLHAPDSHFNLPLCDHTNIAPHSSGPSPKATKINYYGRPLTLSVPLLTPAVILNYTILIEFKQDTSPLHPSTATLPLNRNIANSAGLEGLTIEDVHEFHYGTRTQLFERSPLPVPDIEDEDEDAPLRSKQRDIDWYRLVSCYDPFLEYTPLSGQVYSLGLASGQWDGRILVPGVENHFTVLNNPRAQINSVPIIHERFSCWFEEHHCIAPEEPVSSWDDIDDVGDNVLNAWLPRLTTISHDANGINVYDPTTQRHVRYETYRPERSTPYSVEVHNKVQSMATEWVPGGADVPPESVAPSSPASCESYVLSDDEWEDTVEHRSSGVRDILITGETSQRQGDAWGHYSYVGRVRPWDGLIVLLRISRGDSEESHGRWMFRGYIHNKSLVGRWRDTNTAIDVVGLEGGFVFCKSDGPREY